MEEDSVDGRHHAAGDNGLLRNVNNSPLQSPSQSDSPSIYPRIEIPYPGLVELYWDDRYRNLNCDIKFRCYDSFACCHSEMLEPNAPSLLEKFPNQRIISLRDHPDFVREKIYSLELQTIIDCLYQNGAKPLRTDLDNLPPPTNPSCPEKYDWQRLLHIATILGFRPLIPYFQRWHEEDNGPSSTTTSQQSSAVLINEEYAVQALQNIHQENLQNDEHEQEAMHQEEQSEESRDEEMPQQDLPHQDVPPPDAQPAIQEGSSTSETGEQQNDNATENNNIPTKEEPNLSPPRANVHRSDTPAIGLSALNVSKYFDNVEVITIDSSDDETENEEDSAPPPAPVEEAAPEPTVPAPPTEPVRTLQPSSSSSSTTKESAQSPPHESYGDEIPTPRVLNDESPRERGKHKKRRGPKSIQERKRSNNQSTEKESSREKRKETEGNNNKYKDKEGETSKSTTNPPQVVITRPPPKKTYTFPSGTSLSMTREELLKIPQRIETPGANFSVADIIWSKVSSRPYWPALITIDPLEGRYIKKERQTDKWIYHVQYFGEETRKGWTMPSKVMAFEGREKFLKKYIISPNLQDSWEMAVRQAEFAFKMNPQNRLEAFLYEFKVVGGIDSPPAHTYSREPEKSLRSKRPNETLAIDFKRPKISCGSDTSVEEMRVEAVGGSSTDPNERHSSAEQNRVPSIRITRLSGNPVIVDDGSKNKNSGETTSPAKDSAVSSTTRSLDRSISAPAGTPSKSTEFPRDSRTRRENSTPSDSRLPRSDSVPIPRLQVSRTPNSATRSNNGAQVQQYNCRNCGERYAAIAMETHKEKCPRKDFKERVCPMCSPKEDSSSHERTWYFLREHMKRSHKLREEELPQYLRK